MSRRLRIACGDQQYIALLNDSPTAETLWQALPITSRASTWGDEIYFSIPVDAALEAGARAEVAVGDIAYWPPGSAFCIFFGPTPSSSGSEPVAASPVNVIGRVEGALEGLGALRSGETVRLEQA